MKVDVILGLQWGDEGKGKIVDVLTPGYDIIARFQGGPNAGHTIIIGGRKFILHTIPSGIFRPEKVNLIGNGVIIDPFILLKEMNTLREAGLRPEDNLFISRRAHLILPSHRMLDAAYEQSKGASKIGSTLKGIGPTYTDKYGRNGLRVGNIFQDKVDSMYRALKEIHRQVLERTGFDFSFFSPDGLTFDDYEARWMEAVEKIRSLKVVDSEIFLNESLKNGKKVLAEGAQGTLLDVDFGSYPFVTSSNTITAGACSGLGIPPHKIGTVYGIFKAYCTRVGSGPFPTELNDEYGETLRKRGMEFGSTTGRPRRCGWLDIPALNYAIMLNGVDRLIMMKADVLDDFEEIRICTAYQAGNDLTDLIPFALDENIHPVYHSLPGWKTSIAKSTVDDVPSPFRNYMDFIRNATGVPIDMVSTGPDRDQVLVM